LDENKEEVLPNAALFGLKRIYRPRFAYKKAGVMLMGISPAAVSQGSLLAQHGSDEKSQRLMQVMDKLNLLYGRSTLSVFSTGSRKPWSMRREKMSPNYTTSWLDVPVAHAH
jgi:hypothetical protein